MDPCKRRFLLETIILGSMLVVRGVVWFSNMMPREMGVVFFSASSFQSQSEMNGDPKKGCYPNMLPGTGIFTYIWLKCIWEM